MKNLLLFILMFAVASLCRAQSITLWGMTNAGGTKSKGTIFSFNTSTGKETDVHDFDLTDIDGETPVGSLIQANNGLLYGATEYGGNFNNDGTIISYNLSTNEERVAHNFGINEGTYPANSLIQTNDGSLYGMTMLNGTRGSGTIYAFNLSKGTDTTVHDFAAFQGDGEQPNSSVMQASNGLIYGMTLTGGANTFGMMFSYDISTGAYVDLHDFGSGTDGKSPQSTLIQVNDSMLYGTTNWGGAVNSSNNGEGILFSYNILSGVETDVHDFGSNGDGIAPDCPILASNGKLYGATGFGGAYNSGMIYSYDIPTATETILYSFGSTATDGQTPSNGKIMQASDGMIYGTTYQRGVNSKGTIYSYDISTNTETDIYDFGSGTDGQNPNAALLEVDSTTGINQLTVDRGQLTVYPNPTSGQFTLQLNGNQNGSTIEVYNVIGERVYHSALGTLPYPFLDGEGLGLRQINLSSQPAGLYFVYLKSDGDIKVGKLIVVK